MWLDGSSDLRRQEYIGFIRWMSDVDKHTAAAVTLIQGIIDVVTTRISLTITRVINFILITCKQLDVIVFIVGT